MNAALEMSEMKAMIASLSTKISQMEASYLAQSPAPSSVLSRALQSVSTLDSGDTSWMLISSSLVLFMTLPGLGLFYCGMVREKNVLTTCAQIFTIACLITILWISFGYSLCFGPTNTVQADDAPTYRGSAIYGGSTRLWLQGMTLDSVHMLAPTIPESVFCMYQLTFAIITPALIVGSFADRMKYKSLLVFITAWHLLVYCPIAHSLWHPKGFLLEAGVLDFAGGDVVHISAGVSGLVTTLVIGHRAGFKEGIEFEPSNILHSFMGAAMLWIGWFGFNAGSAVAANGRAGSAMLMTQISTATASLSWTITENIYRKKPSILGMVNGAVAGLVSITPAAGFVNVTGAFFIGLLGGAGCFFGSQLKHYFKYDDALDAFGVHAFGGIIGGLLTGFFADGKYDRGIKGVFYANTKIGGTQFGLQLAGVVFSIAWASIGTFIILKVVEKTIGLRVSQEEEEKGLDDAIHGEVLGPRSKVELINAVMASAKSSEDTTSLSIRPSTPTDHTSGKYYEYQYANSPKNANTFEEEEDLP